MQFWGTTTTQFYILLRTSEHVRRGQKLVVGPHSRRAARLEKVCNASSSIGGPTKIVFRFHSYGKSENNSMDRSPSRVATRSSVSQEIPCILWNPKVHYLIHKRSLPVPSRARTMQPTPSHPTS